MMLAAILFSLTALGGAVLASFPLRGLGRPPTWLALGHGLVAVCSFVALFYTAASGLAGLAQAALAVLLLAAIGGATLFLGFHLRAKPLPLVLVVGHGLLALTGVALLWYSILQ
jgi:hypothetical protein